MGLLATEAASSAGLNCYGCQYDADYFCSDRFADEQRSRDALEAALTTFVHYAIAQPLKG